MPQKKNPTAFRWLADIAVNVRARMMEARNTEGMNRSWVDVINGLRMIPGIIGTLKVDAERNLKLAGEFWSGAADLAVAIVREKGLPWRTAHQIVATMVRHAIEEGTAPKDITEETLDRAALEYPGHAKPLGMSTAVIQEAMDPRAMVERRTLIGGPAPVRVKETIVDSRERLKGDRETVGTLKKRLEASAEKLEKAIEELIG
jgi:argininosuccinate lyase